jgi:hypothetical protein
VIEIKKAIPQKGFRGAEQQQKKKKKKKKTTAGLERDEESHPAFLSRPQARPRALSASLCLSQLQGPLGAEWHVQANAPP